MKPVAVALLCLSAALIPVHAAAPPAGDDDAIVSAVAEFRAIDGEEDTAFEGQAGAQVNFSDWFGLRGSIGDTLRAEIAAVGIFPWRLEVLAGVGLVAFDDLEGDADTAPIYRAGVYFRMMERPNAAFLVGLGVQRVEPDDLDSETDTWLSLGFRGR